MRFRPIVFGALAVLALAGCVQDTQQANTAPPAAGSTGGNSTGSSPTASFPTKPEGQKLKIAVIPKGLTHEFWRTIKAGAEAAGKEMNCEIVWAGPKNETSIQEQQDIVGRLPLQNVDGVALAATNKTALVKQVDELQAKGIPVVMIDSGIDPDHSQAFIATDNVAAAAMAADEMNRILGGKGKVGVLSFKQGAGTSDEREKGFMDEIKKFSGITLIPNALYTDSDANKAFDQMNAMLNANPDLAGVFASNEPNVNGAAKVLQTKNLAGKVKLVGFDASKSEIEYLQSGAVQALVVQDPFKMGYEGVKALTQILHGNGSPQKRIDTGAKVVTKENMAQPEIHKLLYPLEGQQ